MSRHDKHARHDTLFWSPDRKGGGECQDTTSTPDTTRFFGAPTVREGESQGTTSSPDTTRSFGVPTVREGGTPKHDKLPRHDTLLGNRKARQAPQTRHALGESPGTTNSLDTTRSFGAPTVREGGIPRHDRLPRHDTLFWSPDRKGGGNPQTRQASKTRHLKQLR